MSSSAVTAPSDLSESASAIANPDTCTCLSTVATSLTGSILYKCIGDLKVFLPPNATAQLELIMQEFLGSSADRVAVLDASASADGSSEATSGSSVPVGITGDFNCDESSSVPVLDLISGDVAFSGMDGSNDAVKGLSATSENAEQMTTCGFSVLATLPEHHKFRNSTHEPTNQKSFISSMRSEYRLLRTSLPRGIIVRAFESRMDLMSVLIEGPERTPYEDGLFLFDVQLPNDYPTSPPVLHYITHCSDRLNPNLYEDGKVCVSLLGTWSGKGTEVWSSTKSNLLQVLVSIQGLILNQEPYYNEAGYEKQKGTQTGLENSRLYNEMVLVKLVQSMNKMLSSPSQVFLTEIRLHLEKNAIRLVRRLEYWLDVMPTVSGSSVVLLDPQTVKPAQNICLSSDSSTSPNAARLSSETPNSTTCMIVSGNDSDLINGKLELVSTQGIVSGTERCGAASGPCALPDYPLLPLSKGFKLSLLKTLQQFKTSLKAAGIAEPSCPQQS